MYKGFGEKLNTDETVSIEELGQFIKSPELDLPETRRDLSQFMNVKWLSQNILIRNREKVPPRIYEAICALRNKMAEELGSRKS